MPDELAPPQAQEGTAAPAEVVPPTTEQVTSGAQPQTGTSATPDSEALRLKKSQETRERIEELNARSKAAQEYGEYWRQRFEESVKQQQTQPPAPAQEQVEPEPDPDEFDDPKTYTKAYTAWYDRKAEKRIQAIAQQTQKEAETAAERKLAKSEEEKRLRALNDGFGLKQQEFAEKTPGYWDAIKNPALSFFNGDFLEAIKGDEIGPQLAYHIATTPSVVAKLAAQSVPQRLATLGRLAADLSRPPPPPKVTAAPEPPTPIGSGSGGQVEPDKLSTTDWMTYRTKQILAKRQAR
jgi:hypothetical protein